MMCLKPLIATAVVGWAACTSSNDEPQVDVSLPAERVLYQFAQSADAKITCYDLGYIQTEKFSLNTRGNHFIVKFPDDVGGIYYVRQGAADAVKGKSQWILGKDTPECPKDHIVDEEPVRQQISSLER